MAIEREVASIDFAPAPAAAASAAASAAAVASPAAAAGNNTSASKKNNVMGRPALACERCKRRKIKCDAIRPTCGKCVKMKTQCVYSEAAEHQMANPAKKRKRNKRSTQSSTAPDDDRHGSPSTRASFTSRSMSSDIDHQVNDKDLDAAFLLTNLAQTGPPPPSAAGSAGMPPLRDSHSPSYAAMRHHAAPGAYGPGSPSSSHFATAPGGRLPLPADRILPQPFSRHVQFGPLSHDRPAYDPATDFSAGRSGSDHLPLASAPSSLKRSRSRSPSPRRSMVFIDARSRSPARRGGADAYAAEKRSPGMPWPSALQPTEFLPAPPAAKRLSDAGVSTTSSASMRDDEHAVTPHGVHSHWLTVLDGPAPHSPSPRETAIVSPSSPPQSRPWSPGAARSRTDSDPVVHVDTKHEADPAPQSPSSTNGRATAYTVSKPQDRIDLGKLEQGDRAAEAGAVPIKQISQGPHQTWDKMVLFCM